MAEQLFTLLLQSTIVSNCTTIFFSLSQSKVLEEPAELSPSLIRSWPNHGAQENHFLEMFFTMGKKGSFQPSNL
jgi:hypothetical protein